MFINVVWGIIGSPTYWPLVVISAESADKKEGEHTEKSNNR